MRLISTWNKLIWERNNFEPDYNLNPEITDCRVTDHGTNYWYIEVEGTDPNGDLADLRVEIDGIENYRVNIDQERLYYNLSDKKFHGNCYIDTEENSPFSATFIIIDASGNFDTETLLFQVDQPVPTSTAAPDSTPQAPSSSPETASAASSENILTASPTADIDESGLADDNGIESVGGNNDSVKGKSPLLLIGGAAALAGGLAFVIILLIKRRKK